MTEKIFNDWLDEILRTEKPTENIQAYYFGIVETMYGYETYLVGSNEFDEEDDDWACNVDFVPKNKYLLLGESEVDWKLILADVKKYIENFIQSAKVKNSFLEEAKAIAMGFDGGDLFRIK